MCLRKIVVFAVFFVIGSANAELIRNGDFASCSFDNWEKDTDGLGDVSFGNDFEIVGMPSACRAAINVDYFDSSMNPISEAWFANTLYQELDFTGAAGSTFELTIGIESRGAIFGSSDYALADYFLIGLNDGTGSYFDENGDLGFLVGPTDINGANRDVFTFDFGSQFINQSGWFLDFQVNIGWDGATGLSDGVGSTLFVNSVSLVEVPAASVPEPSGVALLGLGLLGVVARRKSLKVGTLK